MKKSILAAITAGILSVALLASLASCAQEGDNITNVTNVIYKEAEEESVDFVSEGLPFYKNSDTPTYLLYARFYKGEHYVPYVSIRYYLECFDVFTVAKTSYSDGKYSYEYRVNGKTFPIVVDVKNDMIYCAEWAGFIDDTNGVEEDAITQKMLKVLKSYSGQKSQTFDLKKYGMEIYGGGDDAYVPLCVLNQLFTLRNYKEIFYNGEGVYYFDYSNSYRYADYNKSLWYMSSDGTLCDRPQKLIDLTYNMLRFTHDYFYGQPGYYGFADDGNGYPDSEKVRVADSLNFDELLSEYAPATKALLNSPSYVDYLKGLIALFGYTYGDSHASVRFFDFVPNLNPEQIKEIYIENLKQISGKTYRLLYSEKELKAARKLVDGRVDSQDKAEPFYVLSGGKTAVFTFDHFDVDIANWGTYYNSTHIAANPNPADFEGWGLTFPNDPTAQFYSVLYKLLNDTNYSDVETILIDVSCNGGGDERCLMKLLAYLIDAPAIRLYDVHTDTRYIQYIYADLNLDGKIDSEDTAYRTDLSEKFKFVILASRHSFSCANAFPNICAEEGIKIIGDRSSGGACRVGLGCTADGFPYQFSINQRISRKSDWSTVEDGVSITSGGEIANAADFYNDAKLQQIIDSVLN